MKSPGEGYPETMTAKELAEELLKVPESLVYMSDPLNPPMCFNVRAVRHDKLIDGTKDTVVIILDFDSENVDAEDQNRFTKNKT